MLSLEQWQPHLVQYFNQERIMMYTWQRVELYCKLWDVNRPRRPTSTILAQGNLKAIQRLDLGSASFI